jgi:hypothetical protein
MYPLYIAQAYRCPSATAFYIFSQQMYLLNFWDMLQNLCFFPLHKIAAILLYFIYVTSTFRTIAVFTVNGIWVPPCCDGDKYSNILAYDAVSKNLIKFFWRLLPPYSAYRQLKGIKYPTSLQSSCLELLIYKNISYPLLSYVYGLFPSFQTRL